jgi:site-specific recombinase XerD
MYASLNFRHRTGAGGPGSLRDVQALAGHSNLSTTQRYIEAQTEAQRRIVELV